MTYEDVDVLIPFRGTCEHRIANADFIEAHLANALPGCKVTRCDDPDPDLFNRGRAVNEGVSVTDRDLLVIADGDVWLPPRALRDAIDTLRRTFGLPRSYVVPFDKIIWLSEEWSRDVRAGLVPITSRPPARHVVLEWGQKSVGITNVVRRDQFKAIGGFDPRFRGWGCEDVAWDLAADTLVGPKLRLRAEGRHLWHPACASKTDPERMAAVGKLLERYSGAVGNRQAMAALIAERYSS